MEITVVQHAPNAASNSLQGDHPVHTVWPWRLWLGIALCMTFAAHIATLDHPFTIQSSEIAWVCSHFATIARSFVDNGIFALKGIPIQNNAPLGEQPDAYINWPPLFPVLLSVAFRLCGESESVARGLMLLILAANLWAVSALAHTCYGKRAGLIAPFAFLATPIMVTHGAVVLHLHLAILGIMLAVLGFMKATQTPSQRKWTIFGVLFLILAILSSWEAVFVCPGLLGAALWQRNKTQVRTALIAAITAVSTAVGLIGWYVHTIPTMKSIIWRHFLYRTRLSDWQPEASNIHWFFKNFAGGDQPSLLGVWCQTVDRLSMIGELCTLALLALPVLGWLTREYSRSNQSMMLFASLLSPWLCWHIFMANHAFIHSYQMLLVVPGASIAFALCVKTILDVVEHNAGKKDARTYLRTIIITVLPATMLIPLLLEVKDRLEDPGRDDTPVTLGRSIERATEPGAVVMMPGPNMVPVYYSRRHIIRGVTNDAAVERVTPKLATMFPNAPTFLVFTPDRIKDYPQSMLRYPIVEQSEELILLAVRELPGP